MGTLQYDPLQTHAFVCYIYMCVMENPLWTTQMILYTTSILIIPHGILGDIS